ncbi:MAG: hypothetical protein ACK4M9_22705 [Anaerobacillus sp.]|uniref:hypothetical protein n=1 Tax=Anaerobacillus sp. TaxID=1872506 RepID=UPI00391B5938
MIKKSYMKIINGLIIVILLITSYNLFQEKRMYEKQLSNVLNSDMIRLIDAIILNDKVYEEIIVSGNITKEIAQVLEKTNERIVEITQKYMNLAHDFGRVSQMNKKTAENANYISRFFMNMRGPTEVLSNDQAEEIVFVLDPISRTKIEDLLKLNATWIESIVNNIHSAQMINEEVSTQDFRKYYGENSITDDFWVNFITDLEQNTETFLANVNYAHMGELFGN